MALLLYSISCGLLEDVPLMLSPRGGSFSILGYYHVVFPSL